MPIDGAGNSGRMGGFARIGSDNDIFEASIRKPFGLTSSGHWSLFKVGPQGLALEASEARLRIRPLSGTIERMFGTYSVFLHGATMELVRSRWLHAGFEARTCLVISGFAELGGKKRLDIALSRRGRDLSPIWSELESRGIRGIPSTADDWGLFESD